MKYVLRLRIKQPKTIKRISPISRISRRRVIIGLLVIAIGVAIVSISANYPDDSVANSQQVNKHFISAKKGPYLISLGGSIAAGAGLKPMYHSQFPFACDQTDRSYAVILAQAEHLPLLQVACSGARTSHGLFQDQIVNHRPIRPQVANIRPRIPGSVVTLFIGANDVHWIHIEYECFKHGCPSPPPKTFAQGLSMTSKNIAGVIDDVTDAGAKAVVVNQYFTVLTHKNAMRCTPHIVSASDIVAYNSMLAALNQAILSGSQQIQGAPVVVVLPHFGNHGLCSKQPWVQGFHDPQPFHPTAAGQEALANADKQALTSAGL